MTVVTATDDHPKRYDPLRDMIEQILIRRLHTHRLSGYTLETSMEIMDTLSKRSEN